MNCLRMGKTAFSCFAIVFVAGCMAPRGATFHPASAMARVGGAGGINPPQAAGFYHLEMVRNEREGFQFAVLPAHGHDTHVSLSVVPDSADAPEFTLYQVLAVNHLPPPTTGQFVVPPRRIGLIPDVLMPVRAKQAEGTALAVKPGEVPLTYYLEFHTTQKTQPGKYRYRTTIENNHSSLSIVVDVREPVIPNRLPFRTTTTWNWSLNDYYGRTLTLEEKQAFWTFFLNQRLSPTAFFSKTPDPSPTEAAPLKNQGLSVMNLTFTGSNSPRPLAAEYKAKMAPLLKLWRGQLLEAGLLDTAVVLLADEPAADSAAVYRQNAQWFKEQFPELRIWVATRPSPEWDFADIFDPVTAHSTDYYKPHSHTDQSFDWRRKTHPDKEYWWFHSVEPYAPYTNVRLDNLPIEARVAGWQGALYGVDGYEYFWMTDWSGNKDTRDMPWPQRAANWKTGMSGAGTLCYPDEKMRPMPSLRLVNLRDGFEDWALIEMLASRNDTTFRQQLVSPVCRNLMEYTTDPQVVLKARGKAIAALARHHQAS